MKLKTIEAVAERGNCVINNKDKTLVFPLGEGIVNFDQIPMGVIVKLSYEVWVQEPKIIITEDELDQFAYGIREELRPIAVIRMIKERFLKGYK